MSKRLHLYDVLGVDVSADEVAIRRAFKKLSEALRPESTPALPDAPERLRQLRAAYDILANPDRRADYDEFGELALKENFEPEAARRQIAKEQEQIARRAKAALVMPTAIQRHETGPDGTPVKRDWSLRVAIGPRLARSGGMLRFPVTRPVRCPSCEGSGRRDRTCKTCDGAKALNRMLTETCAPCGGIGLYAGKPITCPRCNGRGRLRGKSCSRCQGGGRVMQRFNCQVCSGLGLKVFQARVPCGDCNSTGLVACGRCDGRGQISKSLMFKLYVPARVQENIEYRYAGAGFSIRSDVTTDLHVQYTVLAKAPRR